MAQAMSDISDTSEIKLEEDITSKLKEQILKSKYEPVKKEPVSGNVGEHIEQPVSGNVCDQPIFGSPPLSQFTPISSPMNSPPLKKPRMSSRIIAPALSSQASCSGEKAL